VVVRPGPVIGGGDPTLRIAAYLQRLEDGGPLLVPAETYRRPAGLAWVRDAGHALALAADLARPVEGSSFDVAFDGASLAELLETLGQVMGRPAELVPVPTAEMPPGSDPYGPPPEQDLGPARAELGFQPSALEDCLAEVLAWYRATKPSHPGYAGRAAELELARSAR
jgi:nucleoside-diphosphate-sugar epimerase